MRKKEINLLLFLYVGYIAIIVLTEWINLAIKLLRFETYGFTIELISTIAIGIVFCFIKRRIRIKNIKFEWETVICLLVIFSIGFVMSVYPDNAYDTFNYHLIAQNPKFENYFVEDYGYGNFQVWGFRLPDRLFYYFRYLLGFRLGTILNVLVSAISFLELYELLGKIVDNNDKVSSITARVTCNKAIWALVIVLPLDAILMYGSYYVDIIAIPIAIEVVNLLIFDRSEQNTFDIGYFALLNGLWLGLKLTNVIYVLPCVIIYVFEHFFDIKLKQWIVAILIGSFSFLPYLLFNFLCTGNPLFPYYNSLFKSHYFSFTNFKDTRWGPTYFIEKLLWLVYAVIKPDYRQGELYDSRPIILLIGLIGFISYVLYLILNRLLKKKGHSIGKEYLIISIIGATSAWLWAWTTGYNRYFIFGKIIWGIMAFIILVFILQSEKKFCFVIPFVCSILAVVSLVMNLQSVFDGYNWSFHKVEYKSLKKEWNKILSDRDISTDYGTNADMFVLCDSHSMGIAELIDNEAYMYYTEYLSVDSFDYKDAFVDKANKSTNIYSIHEIVFSDLVEYVDKINKFNLQIEDISKKKVGSGSYYLLSLQKGNGTNEVFYSDELEYEVDYDIKQSNHKVSFIGGRFYNWKDSPEVCVKFYEQSSNGSEKELKSVFLENNKIKKYDLDLGPINGKLICRFYLESGDEIGSDEINKAFIMNPKVN